MKNTHLQHPEDSILTGDLSALYWFSVDSDLSLKIDGAPAIVFGTNPANGKFFVGTKSVFNKVKIKINHSHEEIDANQTGEVAEILHHCLDYLPRISGIVQCDFVGYGGDDTYTPNTLTYVFDDIVDQRIIVAPHTRYIADSDLRDAVAYPDTSTWIDSENVKYVKPDCWQVSKDLETSIAFARQMSTLCEYLTPKQSARVQKQFNACIRNGVVIDDITLEALAFDNKCDVNTLRLWSLVKNIKDQMLRTCRNNGPKAYIGNKQCGGEGYVRTNKFGMFKLVNREQFSHANFNNGRFSCAS